MNSDAARASPPVPQGMRTAAGAVLVALPFLFPFATGPSTNVWQLLASWGCVALLLLRGPVAAPDRRIVAGLAVAAAVLAAGGLHGDEVGRWLPACLALAAIGAAAAVGAGLAFEGEQRQAWLPWGLAAAGLVSVALGLLQYFGAAEALVPWTTAPELGQAYGNLRQRNQFASLLCMALVATLWSHAHSRQRRYRVACVVSASLWVVGLAASTSRTGLLELLLVSLASALLAWRERRGARPDSSSSFYRLPDPRWLVGLLPLYLAVAWLLPRLTAHPVEGMFDRLRDGASTGHSRLVLWRNVVELIAQHPWIGWGWGELKFAHYSTLYPGPRFDDILDNAHNLPLHLAVELGLPAALLVCGGFGWLVMRARPWRENDPTRLMLWAVLGIIVLHSLLEYPLWYGPFQLVFGLCLGALWPARVPSSRRRQWPGASVLPKVAGGMLLAVVCYGAWDYTRVSQIYLAREERLPAYRDDTLARIGRSWLFAGPVEFAELTLTPVSQANAARLHALAERALHFSPEPAVVVKLIDSAKLLGLEDEALAQAARFKRAYPQAYAHWLRGEPWSEPPG